MDSFHHRKYWTETYDVCFKWKRQWYLMFLTMFVLKKVEKLSFQNIQFATFWWNVARLFFEKWWLEKGYWLLIMIVALIERWLSNKEKEINKKQGLRWHGFSGWDQTCQSLENFWGICNESYIFCHFTRLNPNNDLSWDGVEPVSWKSLLGPWKGSIWKNCRIIDRENGYIFQQFS